MKWLVTAFEPFAKAQSNSSLIVLNKLRERNWGGQLEFLAPLPVVFTQAWPSVKRAIEARDDIAGILALGQSETRPRLSLERVALNWVDARIEDNSGFKPAQGPIEKGPEILWSPIPWDKLPASPYWERSYSAGTYVCNTLMYQMLNWSREKSRRAGFVHVPLVDTQTEAQFAGCPRMEEGHAVEAVAQILAFLAKL